MHERLRIHHGVGSRVFFDSDQTSCHFTYEQLGEGFVFYVDTKKTPGIEEVLRLKNEVNVFIFREEDGESVEKVWFYTGDGDLSYDEEAERLTIHASSHITYRPQDFLKP